MQKIARMILFAIFVKKKFTSIPKMPIDRSKINLYQYACQAISLTTGFKGWINTIYAMSYEPRSSLEVVSHFLIGMCITRYLSGIHCRYAFPNVIVLCILMPGN